MQIRNCLDEYASGRHVDIEFEGRRYRGVFKALVKLLEMLKKHRYHWNAFTARRTAWHEEARFVFSFANVTMCSTHGHSFNRELFDYDTEDNYAYSLALD
jgi:Domain of unknown function (DUF6532)